MKRMPRLRFSIRYDLRKVIPEGWEGEPPSELSCESSYCFHADFINEWLPEAAENMFKEDSKRAFAGVDGPLGEYKDCSSCEAQNAEPEHGTSDRAESKRMVEEAGVALGAQKSKKSCR